MRPEKIKTWADNWNDVVRYEIYKDTTLKDLMMIPSTDQGNIIKFIEEYFVQFTSLDEPLRDHKVRVIYDTERVFETKVPGAVVQTMTFDIYVKSDQLHNADNDRLKDRAVLIFERIKYLLTRTKVVHGISFRCVADYGIASKTTGFRRYRGVFEYKKTY